MQKDIALTGLTTTPSSHEAPDGDIAAMLNLVNEDAALKPINRPYKIGTLEEGAKLWVHETPDYLHYIKRLADGTWWWYDETGSSYPAEGAEWNKLGSKSTLISMLVISTKLTDISAFPSCYVESVSNGYSTYSSLTEAGRLTFYNDKSNGKKTYVLLSGGDIEGFYTIDDELGMVATKVGTKEVSATYGTLKYDVYELNYEFDGDVVLMGMQVSPSMQSIVGDEITDLAYNGNVVTIASSDQPIQYVFWSMNDSTYRYLGQVPQLGMQFSLSGNVEGRAVVKSLECVSVPTSSIEAIFTNAISVWTISDIGVGKEVVHTEEELLTDGLKIGTQYYIKATAKDDTFLLVVVLEKDSKAIFLGKGTSGGEAVDEGELFTYNGGNIIAYYSVAAEYAQLTIYAKDPDKDFSDADYSVKDNAENYISIIGSVSNYLRKVSEANGKFVLPFFVRYGMKLYDNTFVYASPSQLMIPNWGASPCMLVTYDSNGSTILSEAFACDLNYKITNIGSLGAWKDIITSVVVSISKPISKVDASSEYVQGDVQWKESAIKDYNTEGCYSIQQTGKIELFPNLTGKETASFLLRPPVYSDAQYKKNLLSISSFYEILELKHEDVEVGGWTKIDTSGYNVMYPETGRETSYDNLLGASMKAEKLTTYNGRLHAIGVSEMLNSNVSEISPVIYPSTGSTLYRIKTTTKKNGKEYSLKTGWIAGDPSYIHYFGSQDSNISKAEVFVKTEDDATSYTHKVFKVSPSLLASGSYMYSLDFVLTEMETCTQAEAEKDIDSMQLVPHLNEIYVSEADNPFVFPSANAVQCGRGAVRNIAVNTETVSEGQFGEAPLYAFTDEETWVLSLADTGVYQTKQVQANSVCINPEGVTGLTNGVVYTTVNGIMYAAGKEVQCISDSLRDAVSKITLKHLGKIMAARDLTDRGDYLPSYTYDEDWLTFLRTCGVVHDKVNERIIVYPADSELSYVYSLRSNQWGMMGVNISGKIDKAGAQWILLPNEDGSETIADLSDNQYSADDDKATEYDKQYLITRPIGLDIPDIHKRIKAMIMRGYFRKGSVACGIYGSRDLFNWHLIWTSKDQYLRCQSGTPYKYFIVVAVSDLAGDERIQGMSFDFDALDTDQLR